MTLQLLTLPRTTGSFRYGARRPRRSVVLLPLSSSSSSHSGTNPDDPPWPSSPPPLQPQQLHASFVRMQSAWRKAPVTDDTTFGRVGEQSPTPSRTGVPPHLFARHAVSLAMRAPLLHQRQPPQRSWNSPVTLSVVSSDLLYDDHDARHSYFSAGRRHRGSGVSPDLWARHTAALQIRRSFSTDQLPSSQQQPSNPSTSSLLVLVPPSATTNATTATASFSTAASATSVSSSSCAPVSLDPFDPSNATATAPSSANTLSQPRQIQTDEFSMKWKKSDLMKACQSRGLPISGNKSTLIERLQAVTKKQEQTVRTPSGTSAEVRGARSESQKSSSSPKNSTARAVLSNDESSSSSSVSNAATLQPIPDPNVPYILQTKGLPQRGFGTAIGMILYDVYENEEPLVSRWFFDQDRSIFEAEYTAVLVGLQTAAALQVQHIRIHLDHDVVARQLNGDIQVSKESVKVLYWKVMELKEYHFRDWMVELIPAMHNVDAKWEASKALGTGESSALLDVTDPMLDSLLLLEKQYVRQKTVPKTEKASEVEIDPSKTYLLQFDGGARGNPAGIAGGGMVLFNENMQEVWCGYRFYGSMTNNQAEYQALIDGLQQSQVLGVKRLRVQGDSDLIVRQINGQYRVKDVKLKPLKAAVDSLLPYYESFEISHIYREKNERADYLANHAMDFRNDYGF